MSGLAKLKDSKSGARALYHSKTGYKQVKVFPEWTSAHAIPLVGRFTRVCCVFWLLIFAAAFGVVVWQTVVSVEKYRAYNVSVQQTLSFNSMSFPAVTLCDLNPYKRDEAYKIAEVQTLMEAYEYALQKSYCTNTTCNVATNTTLDDYLEKVGLSGVKSSTAINSKAQRLLTLVTGTTDMTEAGAQYSGFLQGCSFNTQDCQENDWTKFDSQSMGTCFIFNLAATRNVSRVGPIYGLRVILKTNVSQLLPTSTKGGFRVLVHDQGEYPFPDVYGSDVMIGSAPSLGVSFTDISRLSSPYGNCHSDIPEGYLYPKNYSTEGCMRSEYQAQMVEVCGCYDPTYPAPVNASTNIDNVYEEINNATFASVDSNETTTVAATTASGVPVCTMSDITCWTSQIDAFTTTNCTQPCYEIAYETSLSFAMWPSGSTSTIGLCMSGDYGNETCLEMYQENGALLQIYFEYQSYEKMLESAQYPKSTFLSNFGGQLGLWLGGSIIMLIEFVLLLLQFIITFCAPVCDRFIGY
ncbi:unnamed protein product [Bursaphelenchus okinawaensis]|uniref:Uncharacterized protein n=1 Tax=Bursaphelenchus okinawaensis TaxID=465554 RepID=A0A811KMQ3_9BILA|nr:unnamed protein product [Bursaphelenchus okinawaensis]CAG9105748.1 unnamed protein product [Bursaphelenchus okinawaensis]